MQASASRIRRFAVGNNGYDGQAALGRAEERGTPDAVDTHITREDSPMKDLIFVVITIAFFAVGWVYANSFDHL